MNDRWSLAVEVPRIDPIRTEVLVILDREGRDRARAGDGLGSGLRVEGRVRGPICERSTTLPVSMVLAPIPPSGRAGDSQRTGRAPSRPPAASLSDEAILLGAVLNEPAFWTPDLPALYELAASVIEDVPAAASPRAAILAEIQTRIGLRRLWAEGRSIRLDGRRLVIRGAVAEPPPAIEPARPRDTALVLSDPGAAASLAEAADRSGCLLLVRCAGDDLPAAVALARRHPSVGFLIADSREAAAAFRAPVARSRGLLGLRVDATRPPPPAPIAADFLVADLPGGGLPHPAWVEPPPLPVLASRPGRDGSPARADCDRLQADLAAWATRLSPAYRTWDWSGYLVEPRGGPAAGG